MAEHAGKPKVRFAGFTEAWEQRNTSYLGNFFKGQGYSKADLLPDGTPIILYGQLYTNYQFTITEVNTYAQKKKNTILSKGNEVIVPASGETAEDIARASAVRKKGVILGGDLNIIVPIPSMNAEFFALSLSNGFPQKKLAQKAQGKSVVHIHNSDIQEISITYPSLEEQNRIASFFRHLDRLVALHQRKRGRLENIKKAMLEKMFPKNGADVPEIRFAGFTEAWEQREFKNLFKILPNNTLSRAELSFEKGIVKNLHYGDILIKFNEILDSCDKKIPFISREMNFEKIKNAILKNGDVVIADAAEDEAVGKCTEIFNISQNEQIISGLHTIPCRPNIDFAQGFLGYYMNSNSYHSQLVPLMQGIKVLSLSKSSLQDTLITFPRTKKEQARIGTFFRHLDRLITLHQRKVTLLQNIKKACLEKMFV